MITLVCHRLNSYFNTMAKATTHTSTTRDEPNSHRKGVCFFPAKKPCARNIVVLTNVTYISRVLHDSNWFRGNVRFYFYIFAPRVFQSILNKNQTFLLTEMAASDLYNPTLLKRGFWSECLFSITWDWRDIQMTPLLSLHTIVRLTSKAISRRLK